MEPKNMPVMEFCQEQSADGTEYHYLVVQQKLCICVSLYVSLLF